MIIYIISGIITVSIVCVICLIWSYIDDMNLILMIKDKKEQYIFGCCQRGKNKQVKELPKISFNNFLKIYNINRSAYELCDAYVKRENGGRDIAFSFKFFDYLRYKRFKKNKDRYDRKVKMKEEECKVIGELIKLSKEDIEKARESANKNFEEAMNKISSITLKM